MAGKSFGTGVPLSTNPNPNFLGIFLGGLHQNMGPGPYTSEQIQENWKIYFGSSSGESSSYQSFSHSNLNQQSIHVEILEDYGTKNSAVYGLPKDKEIIEKMKNISPSSKYGKLKDGRFGYLFPRSDLEAVKEYLAQKNICFDSVSSKKKESISPSFSEKPKPKNIEISRKNRFGNHCIKGTNLVTLPLRGNVILVGIQDENSDESGLDSIVKLTDEVKEEYRKYKKLIVLDEDNIDTFCEQYPEYKSFFMRMVYDQTEEDEDE